jgi:hypothetical protein
MVALRPELKSFDDGCGVHAITGVAFVESITGDVVRNQRRKGQLLSGSEIRNREVPVRFQTVVEQGLLKSTVTFVTRAVVVIPIGEVIKPPVSNPVQNVHDRKQRLGQLLMREAVFAHERVICFQLVLKTFPFCQKAGGRQSAWPASDLTEPSLSCLAEPVTM